MAKFRKKPVVVEAIRWDGSAEARSTLHLLSPLVTFTIYKSGAIEISTLEGRMRANRGDWIIKGVAGEFYPCKPDIFAATYEAVDG